MSGELPAHKGNLVREAFHGDLVEFASGGRRGGSNVADMAADRNVRTGRLRWRLLRHGVQRTAVPRLSHGRRERVAFTLSREGGGSRGSGRIMGLLLTGVPNPSYSHIDVRPVPIHNVWHRRCLSDVLKPLGINLDVFDRFFGHLDAHPELF
jgi:hypothetical protein